MNLYAIPRGPQRLMEVVAAQSLAAAKRYHPEARKLERYELEAIIVDTRTVQIVGRKPKGYIQLASPGQFGVTESR